MRRWILPALIALSLLITAFALLRPRGPQGVPVSVTRLERGLFTTEVSATGTVRARRVRAVSFAGTGLVGEVSVCAGDKVERGALLARLDSASVRRDLESARSSLGAAEADLARAQADAASNLVDLKRAADSARIAVQGARAGLTDAQQSLASQRQLFAVGGASAESVRAAKSAVGDAARKLEGAQLDANYAAQRLQSAGGAGVAQARAGAESARVRVANSESNLAGADLRAPIAGVVSAVNVTAGGPAPVSGPAFEITDPDDLYVEVAFDETRAAELRPGQPVKLEFDALPGKNVMGRVRAVNPTADRGGGQVASVLARVTFESAAGAAGVRPGYTATARVQTERLEDALTAPLEAVNGAGASSFVWRVKPGETTTGVSGGALEKQGVTVLARNNNRAALRGEGLTAGELLVSGGDELKAGTRVTYTPPGQTK